MTSLKIITSYNQNIFNTASEGKQFQPCNFQFLAQQFGLYAHAAYRPMLMTW